MARAPQGGSAPAPPRSKCYRRRFWLKYILKFGSGGCRTSLGPRGPSLYLGKPRQYSATRDSRIWLYWSCFFLRSFARAENRFAAWLTGHSDFENSQGEALLSAPGLCPLRASVFEILQTTSLQKSCSCVMHWNAKRPFDIDHVKFYDFSVHAHIFYQNILSTTIGDVGWPVLLDSIWSESSVFWCFKEIACNEGKHVDVWTQTFLEWEIPLSMRHA